MSKLRFHVKKGDEVQVISARGSSLTNSMGFLQWGQGKCTGGSGSAGPIIICLHSTARR